MTSEDIKVSADLHPAQPIIDYTYAVLNRNMPDVWDKQKYDNMIPISPLLEEPEFEQYSGPHIVYGFMDESTGTQPAKNSGSLTYAVYDQSMRRLTRTMNILRATFEREDESAREINNYSSRKDYYLGIRIARTSIAFSEGGTPEDEEGGRQSAVISIKYEYFITYDIETDV